MARAEWNASPFLSPERAISLDDAKGGGFMPVRMLLSLAAIGLLMIPSVSQAGKYGCGCVYPKKTCAGSGAEAAPAGGSTFSFLGKAPPTGEIAYSVGGVMKPASFSRSSQEGAASEAADGQIGNLENDINRLARIVHELAKRQTEDAQAIDRLSRIALKNAELLKGLEKRFGDSGDAGTTGATSGTGADGSA